MILRPRLCPLWAVGVGALLLGASPAAGAPHTYTVVMQQLKFGPLPTGLHKGDTIVWVNKDLFPHTVTASGAFDSKSIADGHSWEYTATSKGEFPYTCTFHPTMKATLRVE